MEFRWFCKQKDEVFLMDPDNDGGYLFADGIFLSEIGRSPYESHHLFSGGCFGKGPGMKENNFVHSHFSFIQDPSMKVLEQ